MPSIAISVRRTGEEVVAMVEDLKRAHSSKSYKATHGTFRNYCLKVHNISLCLAYRHVRGYMARTKKSICESTRWAIWERDNFTCASCGDRKYLTVDHIFPESRGGTLDRSNLQTLCRKCNSKKCAKI